MEVTIDIKRPVNLERWKEVKFPDPKLADYDFSEPNKLLRREWYNYAKEDNFDDFFNLLLCLMEHGSSEEVLDIIFKHVAVSGNSLLHVAASHGSKGFTQLLCHHFPLLITRTNFQGDNALHLAARAGPLDTIKDLVNQVKSHPEEIELASLLRTRNDKGNTPLHDAVINGFREAACLILSEDPEVSYYKNRDDKSPLYLAVESRNEEMLASLIEATSLNLGQRKPDLMLPVDDTDGNALHLAASMGFHLGAKLLVSRWPVAATQKNQEGNLPIHIACQKGHIEVVRQLLSYSCDPMDFLNEKGQNILHVAVESGQTDIVREILNNHDCNALKNEKDRDGNTPSHLAELHGHSQVVSALEERMAAPEIVVEGSPATSRSGPKSDRKSQIISSNWKENEAGLESKLIPVRSLTKEEMSSKAGNILVVAVLVAGVTFAGAITLPAGGGDHLKSSTSKHLMNAYIFFDMLAMNCSILAAEILCELSFTDSRDANGNLETAFTFIFLSLFLMCLAFTFSLTVTVQERNGFFCALIVFQASFIVCQYFCMGIFGNK